VATKSIYDDQYRDIIAALRDARLAAHLTQQDVAGRLSRPQSFVAKVEGYERRLDVVEYIALCRAIGVSPRTFLPQ
jgi:transcriptional regulator with XRE-family HTH domain